MEEGEITNSEPDSSWQFNAEDSPPLPTDKDVNDSTATRDDLSDAAISWTASEFIAHHKSSGWYLALAIVAVTVASVVWLLTKDKISASVVVFGAVLFGIYAARKPRQLQFRLDSHGLNIGTRHFSFQDFRSYAIVPEAAFNSIEFVPLKRFAPLTTIYYDPADEAKIVALLADRLAREERQKDIIDRLMWRIRF